MHQRQQHGHQRLGHLLRIGAQHRPPEQPAGEQKARMFEGVPPEVVQRQHIELRRVPDPDDRTMQQRQQRGVAAGAQNAGPQRLGKAAGDAAPLRQRPGQRPQRRDHDDEQHVLGHVPAGAAFRPVVDGAENREHRQQHGAVKAEGLAAPRRYLAGAQHIEQPGGRDQHRREQQWRAVQQVGIEKAMGLRRYRQEDGGQGCSGCPVHRRPDYRHGGICSSGMPTNRVASAAMK